MEKRGGQAHVIHVRSVGLTEVRMDSKLPGCDGATTAFQIRFPQSLLFGLYGLCHYTLS